MPVPPHRLQVPNRFLELPGLVLAPLHLRQGANGWK